MKTWEKFHGRVAMAFLLGGALTSTLLANPIYKVTNVSPNPALTNEFYLTATNVTVSINGTNVRVMVYKDDPPAGGGAPAQIPGPLIEANVGQTIICHFKNKLTNNIEGATIHWHGVELDNDSDGTAVAQDSVFNGQTYTYRFVVPRAGLCWYHSHMIPGTTTFSGMYGPIVLHDTNETALIAASVLPTTNYTFQLMMSDISFTNGNVGKVVQGTNYTLNQLIQFCENDILGKPNADRSKCSAAGTPGDTFLCNGSVPKLAGTFCAPTISSAPVFYVGKNQRIRLQLFNASISRNTYLTLHFPCSNPTGNTNLYHIGGQGGLLDNAVLDGGVQSGYDFKYAKGTVNFGSGAREDVMFYSSGNNGDVIQLVGNSPGGSWNLSGGFAANYPVAFFVVTNGGSSSTLLAVGSPILNAIGVTNENLRLLNTNAVIAPPSSALGASSGTIIFGNGTPANGVNAGPNIGNYAATALDGNSGYGSWPLVPHPPSAVWARAGGVLQLAIVNDSGAVSGGAGTAAHPFHLHGFAMQPVAIYSANLQTNLFTYPFNQFLDTIDILPGEALVFRIKLTDRPIIADSATGGPFTPASDATTGGNVGRWLMHCHIFMHGAVGMISELVVVPNTFIRLVGPQAGTNSVLLAAGSGVPWTATNIAPWLHLLTSSGTGNATVLFVYDANAGPPRTGTLEVGGATVEVTQAGTNYILAPGPVTTLTTNVIQPDGIAVDGRGYVFYADSGNHSIKRWNPASSTVTTLATGIGTPQGIAVDGLGNVYFADFFGTVVKKWSPATFSVTPVFTNTSSGIAGMAADNAGNIYITDPGDHAVRKWSPATGALTTYTTNGLVNPRGVAVDALGNLYAADATDDSVKKLGFKYVFPFFVPNWNTLISSNYLDSPWNLAVDDGGNVYVADGFHNAIKRWNADDGTVDTLVSGGLGDPTGVAVDRTGNVFISDFGNNAVKELPYAYLDPRPKFEPAELTVDKLPIILLPTQNLLPPFAPTPNAAWIFYGGSTTGVVQFAVGANVGGPRSGTLTVLGQPITINQDGASSGIGTTKLLVGPAAGSNTVTEFVIPSIAPWSASTATPWLHLPFTSGTGSGNILFTFDQNTGANRKGTLTLNGKTVTVTQAGANYVPAPVPATTLVSAGLVNPVDVAPDAFGNVIFTDSGNNTVKTWSPGSLTAATVISSGLSTPQGVAVDGSGNIYVSDFGNHAIKQWRAADSNVVTLISTPYAPEGISLDYGTNVYWVMPQDHSVNEWNAASSNSVVLVNTNLNSPYGVAVDIAGNVFIADTSANAIKKWNPLTASLTTVTTTGISSPWNVAVDGSGNVYVANGNGNNILEWVAASGSVVTLVPAGLSIPTDVKVDADQNLYIADYGNGAVKELPHAFVDASPKFEPAAAGSDSLAVVLPAGQNLSAPFAPTDDAAWLTITSTNGGVVSFNFDANPDPVARAATITLLGQAIVVNQAAVVYPPVLMNASMPTNGVFQFSFTNGTRGATYTVLFSTNVAAPWLSWTVIGTATQITADVWQFADSHASNQTRFYMIRSP